MTQIAMKLPFKTKVKVINFDLEKSIFLVTSQKARISRPLRDRKSRIFSSMTKKNRIRPLSINKESPKSQFTILGFASEGAIWAIHCFSGHGS